MIKTEFSGYVKDDTPGQARAILNTDNTSLVAYKAARNREQALSNVVQEVNNLKQDITEIKHLLVKLIDGKQ